MNILITLFFLFANISVCVSQTQVERDSLINNSITMFLNSEFHTRLEFVYMKSVPTFSNGFPYGFEFSKDLINKYNIGFINKKEFKKNKRIIRKLGTLPVLAIWYCYSSSVGICNVSILLSPTKIKHGKFNCLYDSRWYYKYARIDGKWLLTSQCLYPL